MKTFDFGRLRQIRKQKKLRLRDAAQIIGKNASTVSNYENGVSDIGAALFTKLCNIYGTAPEQFFMEKVGNNNG